MDPSDGLTRYAGEAELAELLASELAAVLGAAVAYANGDGGADNTTAIAIDVERMRRTALITRAA